MKYHSLINNAISKNNKNEKGRALENLIEYTINSLYGLKVYDRDCRTKTEEIDLIVMNEQIHSHLKFFGNVILVECKNWFKPIDVLHVDHFISVLERKGLNDGILVAANGVTGTINSDATNVIANALPKKIKVVVLTMKELKTIEKHDDIYEMLLKKYMQLFLGKILEKSK